MNITVGGLMIFAGGVGVVATILATLFALFAQGMSDAPEDRFNWIPSLIALVIAVAFILTGKFSGI